MEAVNEVQEPVDTMESILQLQEMEEELFSAQFSVCNSWSTSVLSF
jgi:hypothetical protein